MHSGHELVVTFSGKTYCQTCKKFIEEDTSGTKRLKEIFRELERFK